jgi:DNA-binding NarL/FixJ family response regulator
MNMNALPYDVRIVLVDDHELVRSGIGALLSIVDGVRVVGEARDGEELMRLLQVVPADLVMSDLTMPGMDGLEALERIRLEFPHIRTIILSMDDSPSAVRRALAQGAAGYIIKQAASAELGMAVRTVAAGGRYVSPAIARVLLQPGPTDRPEDKLTTRQLEVLTLIAQGCSAREIGDSLGLSPKTVDVHRARIMERLDVHDIAGLTRYAVKHRLVR